MTETQQQIIESANQAARTLSLVEESRRKDNLYKCLPKNLRIKLVLREAIRILKTVGWSNRYVGPNGELCVSHAIGRASYTLFGESYRYFPDGILHLKNYIGQQVTQWNDSPGQTRAKIIITLVKAIRSIPLMGPLFTKDEAQEVYEFATGERNFYGESGISDSSMDKLYEAFLYEMPVGIMKARTGEPDVWLGNKLSSYGEEGLNKWLSDRTEGGFFPAKDLWPFN